MLAYPNHPDGVFIGEAGYQRLLAEIEGRVEEEEPLASQKNDEPAAPKGMLFDTADTPLFRSRDDAEEEG